MKAIQDCVSDPDPGGEKSPQKEISLRIWMFSLENRRSPRAWKSVIKACEETCSAILDF